MKSFLLALVSSLVISACGSGSAPEAKVEPKTKLQPAIVTTSRGAVVTNKNSFPYEHVGFAMRGYNFEKIYFYRAPNLAPGEQLGLRWVNFKDDTGESAPKDIVPETLLMDAFVKGGHASIIVPIGD